MVSTLLLLAAGATGTSAATTGAGAATEDAAALAAGAAGARLMTIYSREFSADVIDDALAQLADAHMEREERRIVEGRLKDFRAYEGFVCQLELSFAEGQRTYIFDQPTEWYEEMEQLVEQVEDSFNGAVDENPLGGYFSNN